MSIWTQADTWAPLAQLARAGTSSGSADLAGGGERISGDVDAATFRTLADRVAAVGGIEPLEGRVWALRVSADGSWTCVLSGPDAGRAEEVVVQPGALPAPFRARPWIGTVPVADNDVPLVWREVDRLTGSSPEAEPEQLAAVERLIGFPLPRELRALWSAAAGGEVRVGDSVRFQILLPDAETLARCRPVGRFPGWRYGAMEVLDPSPEDAVQPLAGSPGWIPFAHDGIGDLYCLDLTPGPAGTVGQVIIIEHEESIGACLVADSLTEFILGGAEIRRASPGTGVLRAVRLRDAASLPTLSGATQLEVLWLGPTDHPVDLTPCLGLPAVRTLSAARLAKPEQVLSFPALEYLELQPEGWLRLLADSGLPPGLLAAGIRTPVTGSVAATAAEDRIRDVAGLPPRDRVVLTG